MKKALLIVDPQYDFITGSLPVPDAEEAMNRLAAYITENSDEYHDIVITLDWHPFDHSSFIDFGGVWPVHCVRFSKGASVWDAVFQAVYSTEAKVTILTKGTLTEKEEYSIFQNEESSKTLIDILAAADQVDICGIAGDVCVLSTLSDGRSILGKEKFHVLTNFSPSLDGGEKLLAAL